MGESSPSVLNPLEWTNAVKAAVLSGINLVIQGLTLFNIWDPTADQENWLITVVNFIFLTYILLTYQRSPKRVAEPPKG